MPIRVLLVDDTAEVLERLRILLHRPDIDLVGEAADGAGAQDILTRLPAAIVVWDLNLPVIHCIETAGQIVAAWPGTRVIIVSLQSDPRYVRESFRLGMTGYVLKDCVYEELVEAVHAVAAGRTYVSPEIGVAFS